MRVRQNHHHCEIPQEQEQQQLGELFIPPRPPPPLFPLVGGVSAGGILSLATNAYLVGRLHRRRPPAFDPIPIATFSFRECASSSSSFGDSHSVLQLQLIDVNLLT